MNENLFTNTIQHISWRFENDCSGHDFSHSMRVMKNAMKIQEKEGGNQTIIQLAALLHDVDDMKLFGPNTHDAKSFMTEEGIESCLIDDILHVISQISFKGTDSIIPDTLEGRIVQDADRLDAIGAIGIARTFAYGGSRGRKIYDPNEIPNENMDANQYFSSNSTSINHFYEKLLKLKDMMNTDAGKHLAEERHSFMELYLKQFYKELYMQ